MKKYLIIMAMLCSVFSVRAQFGDNKHLLGGAINGNYYRFSSDSRTSNVLSFGLRPQVARVLSGNSVIGVNISGSAFSSKGDDNAISNSRSISAGLFYERYYSLGEKLFFTAKLGADVSTSKNTYGIDDDEQSSNKQRTASANLNPGLAWKASDRVLLNASIGVIEYSTNTYYPGSSSPSAEIITFRTFQIGFRSPSFGVSFLFN